MDGSLSEGMGGGGGDGGIVRKVDDELVPDCIEASLDKDEDVVVGKCTVSVDEVVVSDVDDTLAAAT